MINNNFISHDRSVTTCGSEDFEDTSISTDIYELTSADSEVVNHFTSKPDYFSNIPLEVLTIILEKTSSQDIANARRISRKFRNVAAMIQILAISSKKLKLTDVAPEPVQQKGEEIMNWLLFSGVAACGYLTHADFWRLLFGINQIGLERLVENCPNIGFLKANGPIPWEPLTIDFTPLHSLQELDLWDFEIKPSLKLPQSLQVLSLSHSPLDSELELPNSLRKLRLVGGAITCVPKVLPKSLRKLDLSRTKVTSLPEELPNSLELLNCESCSNLEILPSKLPHSLRKIDLSYSKITVLPQLPDSLEVLNCESCDELTTIPTLPNSLQEYTFIFCDNLENPPDPLYIEPQRDFDLE